jgi:hypothetical protein
MQLKLVIFPSGVLRVWAAACKIVDILYTLTGVMPISHLQKLFPVMAIPIGRKYC